MYILENNNKLSSAEKCKFSDLGLKERSDLQEWIAADPSVLGEDLLIIQKEFDGFSDTKERLDLLALDKQGQLVIIENKLDDSGRDVTWQAIKYASYCSTMSKQEIIEIFAKYLGDRQEAIDNIVDFLEIENIEDIELNPGENRQRIFFVAANFKKEVTSSVLWLSKFGLNITCFKVTPFRYNGHILIDFDQIIPIKDAEDYIIRMAKKTNEATTSVTLAERGASCQKFWAKFIEFNSSNGGIYSDNSPSTSNWLSKSFVPGILIKVIINKNDCRVECYFHARNNGKSDKSDKGKNKSNYDFYFKRKVEIESKMPNYPLVWECLDNNVTCSIKSEKQLSYLNSEEREEIFKFLTDGSKLFWDTFSLYK